MTNIKRSIGAPDTALGNKKVRNPPYLKEVRAIGVSTHSRPIAAIGIPMHIPPIEARKFRRQTLTKEIILAPPQIFRYKIQV